MFESVTFLAVAMELILALIVMAALWGLFGLAITEPLFRYHFEYESENPLKFDYEYQFTTKSLHVLWLLGPMGLPLLVALWMGRAVRGWNPVLWLNNLSAHSQSTQGRHASSWRLRLRAHFA